MTTEGYQPETSTAEPVPPTGGSGVQRRLRGIEKDRADQVKRKREGHRLHREARERMKVLEAVVEAAKEWRRFQIGVDGARFSSAHRINEAAMATQALLRALDELEKTDA